MIVKVLLCNQQSEAFLKIGGQQNSARGARFFDVDQGPQTTSRGQNAAREVASSGPLPCGIDELKYNDTQSTGYPDSRKPGIQKAEQVPVKKLC